MGQIILVEKNYFGNLPWRRCKKSKNPSNYGHWHWSVTIFYTKKSEFILAVSCRMYHFPWLQIKLKLKFWVIKKPLKIGFKAIFR
jgi:hypothetical protein